MENHFLSSETETTIQYNSTANTTHETIYYDLQRHRVSALFSVIFENIFRFVIITCIH